MNWSSFVPDLVTVIVGTGLTLSAAGGTYFYQQRRKNRQLVQNLADDLSVRRAFVVVSPSEQGYGSDAEQCFRSVQAAQDRIVQVRDEIAPNRALRTELQAMIISCVAYKEKVELGPRRWVYELMILRTELTGGVRSIEKAARIRARSLPEPGQAVS